ncbi:hypothetical protein [Tardiphaga sp.]|jgi:hypothetical protein|uniref:hypothetical protein n=1 Tax=Tardiphaga sp. TaxID=1926292 RepID=UPI0037DA2F6A
MTPGIFSSKKSTREILVDRAERLRRDAEKMLAGVERDRVLKHVRQIETEARAEGWANSTGLQPPK